ncbi:MAG: peptidase M50 [Syntrophus sp. (in: bacteria)]|nr:peptidase M50 [Syntrophus sp. (in: bacteria)]
MIIISIIAFILIFSLVVLVHEFGHFIAARKAGVKVYEFSIGFPFSPRILTFFRHKETEFTLRLLPLGGFVSFSQGNDDDTEDLYEVSCLKRLLIMSAGSLFNIAFALIIFIPVFMIGKHLSFVDALLLATKTAWTMASGTIMFLFNLFSGHGTMEGLSGPIGIAVMAGQAASAGILNLLYFSGVLSMSLGIMNLIPFPALDGGQIFMLCMESIRKRPFQPRTYQIATMAGLALFLILTAIVTYKDIVKLIV